MKPYTKIILPLLAAAPMLLASCIADEPLNAECDITGVDSLWLDSHKDILIGSPIVTNEAVAFTLKKGESRTALNPSFYLTEGATLTMKADGSDVAANGVTRDFSLPQVYTTHSQDGKWSKDYNVSFSYPSLLDSLHFENYDLYPPSAKNPYHVWYEVDPTDVTNPRRDYWSSGNGGYKFVGIAKTPDAYPTCAEADGVRGRCVKLTTCSTGSFGRSVKMAIAAGSIFIGSFNAAQATKKPREATLFGLPSLMAGRPDSLQGYYKYTPGETFTDSNWNVVPERRDTADIYAVVYECDPDNFEPLNGDNVLSSDRIVLMARIADPGEPADWLHFSVPFELQNGKQWDDDRMNRNGYAITVVATSSRQGAYFEGAVGSTLWIDELLLKWK